jgi:hypothetical protein
MPSVVTASDGAQARAIFLEGPLFGHVEFVLSLRVTSRVNECFTFKHGTPPRHKS